MNCNSLKYVTQQRMKNIFHMPEDNLIHHFNHFSSFTQGKSKLLLKYPIEILASNSKVVLKKQAQQKILS